MSKRILGKSVTATDETDSAPVGLVGVDMTSFIGQSKPRWWLVTLDAQFLTDDVYLWGALGVSDDAADDVWGLHQDQFAKFPLGHLGSLAPGRYQFMIDGLGLYTRVALSIGGTTQEAFLDLGTLGSGALDTVVEAQAVGAGGELLTIEAIGDSAPAGGVTIDESGAPAIVIHYESAVSTVADVETAIGGATLIQVKTTGTGATVLDVATDDFGATNLDGGITHVGLTLTEILEAGRGN